VTQKNDTGDLNMFRFGDGRDWFFEKRFGLFIHWGLYAIHAWHEQEQYRASVPRKEYRKLIRKFNPVKFDADAWLDLAEKAGMEYLTVTAKHVDGFCLWDTAHTDYNIMNTPYGRDVIGMLAEACHRRGFPLCLYYSIPDLNQPNFPHEGLPYELPAPEPGDEPDFDKYLAFIKEQIRELCTKYGEIHGIWWDANKKEKRDRSLNELIRDLQPKAVINHRGFDEGDFDIAERDWSVDKVNAVLAFEKPLQGCTSVGRHSWGYKEHEDYHTDRYLLESICKILGRGGSYMLNVGPMADGTFPPEAVRILRTIGKWHHTVKEAFDGTEPASELIDNRQVLLTKRENVLYVLLFKYPEDNGVPMRPIEIMPRKATLLNTGEPVETRVDILPKLHRENKPYLRLCNLPANEMPGTVLVVRLEFDEAVG